jgi:membrane protein
MAQADLLTRARSFVELWIELFKRHRLLDHASSIAFQVLKALIPLTLCGLALLAVVGEEKVWRNTLAPSIKPHLQQATYHAIDAAVDRIFSNGSGGLLAFSALLSFWYISSSVRAVMTSVNDIYEAHDERPWLTRFALSLGLAVCIAFGVIGAALIVLAGPQIARHGVLGIVIEIGRWPIAALLLMLAVGLLVRFAPAERRPKRWTSAGSALVICAWIVASVIFRLFVTEVANFKTATGSLTVFLVMIGYVYTSSIIFLVGVQLDEVLRKEASADERGVLHVLFGFGR